MSAVRVRWEREKGRQGVYRTYFAGRAWVVWRLLDGAWCWADSLGYGGRGLPEQQRRFRTRREANEALYAHWKQGEKHAHR